MLKLCVQVAYCSPGTTCYMASAIKGQTKATVAFKCNSGFIGLISLELCMQVAYWRPGTTCYMAFVIKGQTKAAVAFKGNFGIYGPKLV